MSTSAQPEPPGGSAPPARPDFAQFYGKPVDPKDRRALMVYDPAEFNAPNFVVLSNRHDEETKRRRRQERELNRGRFTAHLGWGVALGLPILLLLRAMFVMASCDDTKSVIAARTTMDTVCKLMQTGDSVPARLDLETLAPLSLPAADRGTLLHGFKNGRLEAYRALAGGGYEVLARANDTRHTWIRGKNGRVTTAGAGEEPTQ